MREAGLVYMVDNYAEAALKEFQRIFGESRVQLSENSTFLEIKLGVDPYGYDPDQPLSVEEIMRSAGFSSNPIDLAYEEIVMQFGMGGPFRVKEFYEKPDPTSQATYCQIEVKELCKEGSIKKLEKLTPLDFRCIGLEILDFPTREFYERHSDNLQKLKELTGAKWKFRRNKEKEDDGFYAALLPKNRNQTITFDSFRFLGQEEKESQITFRERASDGRAIVQITADWFENSDLKTARESAALRGIMHRDKS